MLYWKLYWMLSENIKLCFVIRIVRSSGWCCHSHIIVFLAKATYSHNSCTFFIFAEIPVRQGFLQILWKANIYGGKSGLVSYHQRNNPQFYRETKGWVPPDHNSKMTAGTWEEFQMLSTFPFGYFGWKFWTTIDCPTFPYFSNFPVSRAKIVLPFTLSYRFPGFFE